MYGIEADATRITKITDKLLPMMREWQNRPLETTCAMVMLDAIHYKVREDGAVVKKSGLHPLSPITGFANAPFGQICEKSSKYFLSPLMLRSFCSVRLVDPLRMRAVGRGSDKGRYAKCARLQQGTDERTKNCKKHLDDLGVHTHDKNTPMAVANFFDRRLLGGLQ